MVLAPAGPLLEDAELIDREYIAPGFWCLTFRSPQIASRARAAQYVAIDVPGDFAVRLPLGIWTVADASFCLLFRQWGKRTTRLVQLPVGARLSLLGPLGNCFESPPPGSSATIVAGGLGIVPFWLLTKELLAAGVAPRIVFGARHKDLLVGADRLRELGPDVELCSDDGSAGKHASAVDVLRTAPKADMLYGCGPPAMLRALSTYAAGCATRCQISMEETFGCCLGTCWGCVIALRRGSRQATAYPAAHEETRAYDLARVCIDGTVFESADVVWPR